MTQMTIPAFRFSANPALRLARLRCLARPAGQGLLLAALLLFLAGTAQAAGSSMPWEGPLTSILESIQGPVARIVAVIIIISTGLALALAQGGEVGVVKAAGGGLGLQGAQGGLGGFGLGEIPAALAADGQEHFGRGIHVLQAQLVIEQQRGRGQVVQQ